MRVGQVSSPHAGPGCSWPQGAVRGWASHASQRQALRGWSRPRGSSRQSGESRRAAVGDEGEGRIEIIRAVRPGPLSPRRQRLLQPIDGGRGSTGSRGPAPRRGGIRGIWPAPATPTCRRALLLAGRSRFSGALFVRKCRSRRDAKTRTLRVGWSNYPITKGFGGARPRSPSTTGGFQPETVPPHRIVPRPRMCCARWEPPRLGQRYPTGAAAPRSPAQALRSPAAPATRNR